MLITVPATVLVVVLARAGRIRVRLAGLPGPGRPSSWSWSALLVVPVQIGADPGAPSSSAQLGIFGTIPGVVLFHVAFGLPFAIFLLRNFFAEIPKEMLEAARMDGGSEWRIFTPAGAAAGLPGDRVAGHLPVPVGVERPAGGAGVRRQLRAAADRRAQSQMRQFGSNIDVLAPGAFLSLIVPVVVFFAFQRYFVQGVMAGSVK